jgi:methylamine dehydrogenase accessory protein MauD
MSVWWTVSFAILWVLILVLFMLTIGVLRQLGLVLERLRRLDAERGLVVPTPETDGPSIGTRVPALELTPVNGAAEISLRAIATRERLLLVFLSPDCQGCQRALPALCGLTEKDLHVVGVIRAKTEVARTYLDLFWISFPLVADVNRDIAMSLGVHGTPFGLLYENGMLVRKCTLAEGEVDVAALLGTAQTTAGAVTDALSSAVNPV